MNQSDLNSLSDEEVMFMFKGMFRDLAPIQIPLSIIVLIQNTVIFMDYYRDRAKFVSGLLMGIALFDILKAQGEIVLSVTSILVYAGYFKIDILYKSLFYYMMTALPGINCSKICNLVLTITLTLNVVNPFRRLNTEALKKVVRVIWLIITLIHISDAITAIIIDKKLASYGDGASLYLFTLLGFSIPGINLLAAILCPRDNNGDSQCTAQPLRADIVGGLLALLYFLIIPLTVFICMMIQIKYLRRSLQNDEETTPHFPNTARHVSITVFLVSTLFFVCNATFFFGLTWILFHQSIVLEEHSDKYFMDLGIQVWGCNRPRLLLIFVFFSVANHLLMILCLYKLSIEIINLNRIILYRSDSLSSRCP